MTEAYERELFGLRCGDLIETIGALLKFRLEDWQRHRLETLRAELVSNKGLMLRGCRARRRGRAGRRGRGKDAAAQDGRAE